MALWFRKNAGIVVFNARKEVLICRRIDKKNSWQFPQGGIEENETAAEAAKRELKEETSLENVVLIKTLDTPARYHFPKKIIASMTKRGYTNAGQDMFWSLFYFGGSDSEINLETAEPEFSAFKWVPFEEACKQAVSFKKVAYAKAFEAFSSLIESYTIPE